MGKFDRCIIIIILDYTTNVTFIFSIKVQITKGTCLHYKQNKNKHHNIYTYKQLFVSIIVFFLKKYNNYYFYLKLIK